ncbi:tetratricopeptide repeat protein [Aestuariivita sp.]|jgi:tetratricopeptide (TPR) repeat protein|uniref:tetratricopeptide repeat protein n=1 Tax=Aestuariivita sp. TaxID=1872407 RepID=UPI002170E190|nr:tetratricopeptide repeat protein [Aestuariivita sp.]MCE8005885.1 tetratricopeptide repeat protein [Aestuariivita sp.]
MRLDKADQFSRRRWPAAIGLAVIAGLAACAPGGFSRDEASPFAPGTDLRAQAVDGVEVGHRLMQAGQYELALEAFTRAALEQGITAEILTSIGSANLGLGRLGQAEDMLRRAVETEPEWPEAWNNLGVVLMERGETAEAVQIFRKAFALDNGQSASIRDNLRLALAKSENPDTVALEQDYKLVRRGRGEFLIRKAE